MDTLPYLCRNYMLLEKQCIDLFSIVVIDDQCLDLPNATYSALIYGIAPTIESLAKALHKELAQTDLAKSRVDPELQEFNAKEHFDYRALAFLDQALDLSQKQVKLTSKVVALSEESGNRILTPLLNAHKSEHAAEAAEAEAAAIAAAKAAEKAKAKAEEAAAKAEASAEAATKAADAAEATTKAEAKAEAATKAKEAKSAANAAANAATKAAKAATKAAEAAEAATKAEGANQPCQRPLWIKAYQDYKHDQANARQNSANCPTARALLEAIGAAFLLLTVAKSLPLKDGPKFSKFDFTFGSELFEATYTRPTFTNFKGHLSPENLQLDPCWRKALFVVKDTDIYIITSSLVETSDSSANLEKDFFSNQAFLDYYNEHQEEIKEMFTPTPSDPYLLEILIISVLSSYTENTQDQAQKAWSDNMINRIIAPRLHSFILLAKAYNIELSCSIFDPFVAFNHYKKASEIYAYDKLSQDNHEAQKQ